MGSVMQGRLKYLYRDRDRHSTVRYYVCVPGRKKVRIKEAYGTKAFMQAYADALEGGERQVAGKTGSLAWLIRKYYQSAEFKALHERTRYVRRGILDRVILKDGGKPYRMMEARHVRERRDGMADRPEAANGYLKAMRQVFAWACEPTVDLATANPFREVGYIRTKSDGFHTWTRAEVEQFVERHPIGTKAHLALSLLLYTGVRRSDVVRLGRQMEQRGWLRFTVTKTRTETEKPILPPLRAALDACPSGHLTYLVTEFGKPFTTNGFGNWFRKRCNEAGLPHCSAHGLRKAGATIAAENGATEHELMALFDWTNPKQAAHYTKRANRRHLTGTGSARLTLESPTSEKVGEKQVK